MMTKADIIAKLQQGESLEDIAAKLTDVLNAAQEEYNELQEQERLAQLAEAKRQEEKERAAAAKIEAVEMMLDGLCDYLVAAGEDEMLDDLHQVDVNKIITMLDSSIELSKRVQKLSDLEFVDINPLFRAFGFNI
jgi:nucleoid-associated protein YejK